MTALTRVTVNLTPAAVEALDRLAGGGNRTDQINAALRLAAVLRPLLDEDGALTVVGPGDVRTRIVVL